MSISVFSYSDVIRQAAKHPLISAQNVQTAVPTDSKQQLTQVARVYSAISKYLNKSLRPEEEVEVPYFGTFIAKTADTLLFAPSQTLADEAGGMQGSGAASKKRKEVSLGKVAEVCLLNREQVKTIL
jgi:hypothetical protein